MRCLGQRSYRSYSELGFKEKGENSSDGDETASSGLNILELKGSLTDGKNSTRGEESVEQSELLKFERWAEKRETNDAEVKYSGKASDQNSKRFKLGLRLGALGGHHILGGFVCASEAKFAFRRIRKFSSCGSKPGTDSLVKESVTQSPGSASSRIVVENFRLCFSLLFLSLGS